MNNLQLSKEKIYEKLSDKQFSYDSNTIIYMLLNKDVFNNGKTT